jgi:hypothetical protein
MGVLRVVSRFKENNVISMTAILFAEPVGDEIPKSE